MLLDLYLNQCRGWFVLRYGPPPPPTLLVTGLMHPTPREKPFAVTFALQILGGNKLFSVNHLYRHGFSFFTTQFELMPLYSPASEAWGFKSA